MSVRTPRPSFPSAVTEPGLRRLGVRSSVHGEKPIRSQVVLLVGVALLVFALPLYLLRKPSEKPPETEPEVPSGFSPTVPVEANAAELDGRVQLGSPVRIRCGPHAGRSAQEGNLCDALPTLEKALAQAITETVDCAPRTGDQGSLNYVLKVDFTQKTLHVFPGASGLWKGPQARRATNCVKQALPAPEWEKIAHQHNYYEFAILATYFPPAPSSLPLFE